MTEEEQAQLERETDILRWSNHDEWFLFLTHLPTGLHVWGDVEKDIYQPKRLEERLFLLLWKYIGG